MPEIETPRLLLRRLVMADAASIFEYGQDPVVAEHVLWSPYRSLGEAKAFIRYMQRRYRMGDPASWGITLKDEGRVIGTIGYMWIQDDNAAAEVGYSLARAKWNQGIMTEALSAVIDYSFGALRLNRVEAVHEVDNPASGAVMRKCGMRREGLLREKLMNKGKFVDVELYAILRRDYEEMDR